MRGTILRGGKLQGVLRMTKRRRLFALLAALVLIFCTAALPASAKSFSEMRRETPKYTTNNAAGRSQRASEAASVSKYIRQAESKYTKEHHNNNAAAQAPGNAYQDTNNNGRADGNEQSKDKKKGDEDDKADPAIYHAPTPNGTERKGSGGKSHCVADYYFFKNATAFSLGGMMSQTFWPFLIKICYWLAKACQNVFYYNSFNTLNFIGTEHAGWYAIYGKSGFTKLLLGLLTVSIVAYGIYIFLHYDQMGGHGKDLAKQVLALICLLVGLPSLLGFGNLLLQDEVKGFNSSSGGQMGGETMTVDAIMRRYTIDWLYLAACGNLDQYGNVYDGQGIKETDDKGVYTTPDLHTGAGFMVCSERTAEAGPANLDYDQMMTSDVIDKFEEAANNYAESHDKGKYDYTIPDDVKNSLFKYNASDPPQEVADSTDGLKFLTTLAKGNGPWYRYHYMTAPLLLFLTALTLVTILASVRILRLVFDLAFSGVIAPLFAVTDFVSGGARTKEIVRNIISIYLALMFIPLLLGLYNLGVQWILGTAFPLFFKAFVLFIWSWATIDGPDILKKLIGQDVGLRDGWRAAVTGAGIAKGAARGGKKIASHAKQHHEKVRDSKRAARKLNTKGAAALPGKDGEGADGPGEPGDKGTKNDDLRGNHVIKGENDKNKPLNGGGGNAIPNPEAQPGEPGADGVEAGAVGAAAGAVAGRNTGKESDGSKEREQALDGNNGVNGTNGSNGLDEINTDTNREAEMDKVPVGEGGEEDSEKAMEATLGSSEDFNRKTAEEDGAIAGAAGAAGAAALADDGLDGESGVDGTNGESGVSGSNGTSGADARARNLSSTDRMNSSDPAAAVGAGAAAQGQKTDGRKSATSPELKKQQTAALNKTTSSMRKSGVKGTASGKKAQSRMQQTLQGMGYSKQAAQAGVQAAGKYGGGMKTAKAAAAQFDNTAKNQARALGGNVGKNGSIAGLPAGKTNDVVQQANKAADSRAKQLASAFQTSPEQKMNAYSSKQAAVAPSPNDNYADGAVGIASEVGSGLGFRQAQMDELANRTSQAMQTHLAANPGDQEGAYNAGINAAQSYAQTAIDHGTPPGTVSSTTNAYGASVPGAEVTPAVGETTSATPVETPVMEQQADYVPAGNGGTSAAPPQQQFETYDSGSADYGAPPISSGTQPTSYDTASADYGTPPSSTNAQPTSYGNPPGSIPRQTQRQPSAQRQQQTRRSAASQAPKQQTKQAPSPKQQPKQAPLPKQQAAIPSQASSAVPMMKKVNPFKAAGHAYVKTRRVAIDRQMRRDGYGAATPRRTAKYVARGQFRRAVHYDTVASIHNHKVKKAAKAALQPPKKK